MIFNGLNEAKALLDIPAGDKSEDKKILILAELTSSWLEEATNRDFSYKARVQYYDGTGTQMMLLKNRPVYPNPPSPYSAIQVIYDPNGHYGTSPGAFVGPTARPLVYGTDYSLKIDQDDGSSRSGILVRFNEYWIKPFVRQAGYLSSFVGPDTGSYQVTYTAGYTLDTLPGAFRLAAQLLLSRLLYIFPLGVELNSEGYEDRSISVVTSEKLKLMALIEPLIRNQRNWRW